ncbi:MAG: uncharacterized protein QOH32_427 [Bradyrhizobium sp.]|nr:uncharacterized protein [Bradyrhizobium sp.]
MTHFAHRFASRQGSHLLVADGSRIYDLDARLDQELTSALDAGDPAVDAFLSRYGLSGRPHIDDVPIEDPPIRALSLAVAQKCNLGCTYCYAQGGDFGVAARNMPWPVARDAVLRLLENAGARARVNIAFMGGEPLLNRDLIRRTTEFAQTEARSRQIGVGFSITTNGTLLRKDDADFFERYGFAVTVSIDGRADAHDRLRSFRQGHGSYDVIVRRIRHLLDIQQQMQVSARVTVTPMNLDMRDALDHLINLGFHSVGFAPMLAGPDPTCELDVANLETMLAEMIACGRKFEAEIVAGRRYPFSNMIEALRQIHRGAHRPYPCGAGAGYFGVSADGGLFACHRFVEDPIAKLGDVEHGLVRTRRNAWLAERHVHRQTPCNSCWARYLCGGGCHHEVIHRGRSACDFIRGWLDFCLTSYVNVMEQLPTFFEPSRSAD